MSEAPRGGVVIGRFMPPHAGHEYLIRFASGFTRDLTVFLCTLAHEPIPGELRFAWMARLFPDVHLVHITEEIPNASRSSEGAHAIWARAIRERLDHDPRYVFASEEYGRDLAAALGAQFVPVDPQRDVFPISAGMIRENPMAQWRYIPNVVRPYFARKVVLVQADDGLMRSLAAEYETHYATDYPEYVTELDLHGPVIESPVELARAQAASESALLERVNRVLFTPVDPLLTLARAGRSQDELADAATNLLADFPYLEPSLVVSTEELPASYRAVAADHGWNVEICPDGETAASTIRTRVDSWLTKT
ncbi:MAG: transcriptional regulator [Spirochaetota bacterium]